jgi:hypothetical protein
MSGSLLTTAASVGAQDGGRRRSRKAGKGGVTAKTMKKVLKKAGLKTTGKKAALTKRVKKAGLMKKVKGGEKIMA